MGGIIHYNNSLYQVFVMNMIVYQPKTEEDRNELRKKAALLQSQAVLQYIQQLSCPNDQKQALVEELYTT
ncbi:hypothetical protein [Lacrimispora celerecrescens]|uniref:hypothetical protein n=2 Tax=Bacillota TaxID=1239 RepID=UPI00140DAD5E|nr:hypothetical protein [Lacrimispora celerecrescens]